ncbi:protein-tyrosine phosphatase-like protein [Gorgonomyces haynaldii]|nr:protein-tyrosine phosphatase-like protein [Gorgonomyces haynaldii]
MQRTKSNGTGIPSRLPNQPSPVQYKHLQFVIFDAPSDGNLESYIKELQSHKVKDVVRACEPTYSKDTMLAAGIQVHDLPFPDGEAPPDAVIHQWLTLVNQKMGLYQPQQQISPIGVHCVAGLGRAPVLVAMALIEAGMPPLDSVIYIRERRRGAINAKQLKFIEAYKKRSKESKCSIM